jgi:bifunctional dethiobiotin synthetase / adenosylmethionine---8-amino-7-oxononanoate aminotransferase
MVNGKWRVEFPPGKAFAGTKYQEFSSLDAILDVSSRRGDTIFSTYSIYVSKIIRSYRDKGHKFGALILEPVVLGAGGMIFVYVSHPVFE